MTKAGAFLRAWRKRNSLTQAEMAKLLLCHSATVINVEKGNFDPSYMLLERIFKVTKAKKEDLFDV